MNKREIVSLIDLNKKILENKKYDSIVLPEFDEIKDELDILNMEINEGKRVIANAQNEIRKYSCDHSVRFHYPSGWGLMMDDKCVFCGKGIENDCIVNSNTIYEDVNRNRYCVRFISNYFYDCDFYCDSGYDEVDVYEILLCKRN